MRRILSRFFLLINIAFTLMHIANAAGDECIATRYTFDVGSGSMKLGIVKVDKCKMQVVEFIKNDMEPVIFQRCLEQAPDHSTLSDLCIKQGIEGMRTLLDRNNVDCQGKDQCAGIATAWARKTENITKMLQAWRALGVKIHTISQQQEGDFAYRAAILHPAVRDKENVAILDIGGGSFQISTQTNVSVDVFSGQFGAFSFKKLVNANLSEGEAKHVYYDAKTLPHVFSIARGLIKPEIHKSAKLLHKIKTNQLNVVAVGRLFINAFMQEMNFSNIIYKKDVKTFIESLSGLTEEQVLAKYPKMAKFFAANAQIAAILLYTIMDSLNIEKLEVVDARLFDYIALNQEFWQ